MEETNIINLDERLTNFEQRLAAATIRLTTFKSNLNQLFNQLTELDHRQAKNVNQSAPIEPNKPAPTEPNKPAPTDVTSALSNQAAIDLIKQIDIESIVNPVAKTQRSKVQADVKPATAITNDAAQAAVDGIDFDALLAMAKQETGKAKEPMPTI